MSPEQRPQEWTCRWGSGGWLGGRALKTLEFDRKVDKSPWEASDTNWHWDLGGGCGRTYSTQSLGERRATGVPPLGRHRCHGILRAI